MTDQKQPEALQIADRLNDNLMAFGDDKCRSKKRAIDELFRLHAENTAQRAELVAEAARTADATLRADQMTEQHRMQCNISKSAVATLVGLGYTDQGGEQWTPPIGKAPDSSLQAAAYARGWYACTGWAKRPDLASDIGSPAYVQERERLLNQSTDQPSRECLQQSAKITDAEIDRIAESMPGGMDGFLKGWGWRQFARSILQAAPPAPAAVAVQPAALESSILDLEAWEDRSDGEPMTLSETESVSLVLQELKRLRALAAAPAQLDLRKHLRWALQLLRNDEGGCCGQRHSEAVHALERADAMAAWGQEPAAPAQAVAVPADAVAAALIRLDAIYQAEADDGEFKPRPDWLVTALRFAAAPAQEHATQLAGQGQEPAAWLASYQDREGDEASYVTTHYALAVENDARGQPVALYPAAPAQAHKDERA